MIEEQTGEVNEITEELTPEVTEEETEEETPKKEEKDEDEIVPPLDKEVTKRDVEELKESSSKPSPDEKKEKEEETETETEEETEEEETEEEVTEEPQAPKQPKPVEGETPRETALRIKVSQLRQKIRDKDKVIEIADPVITDTKEYDELKELYTDDELKKVEKLFDVIGKKKGYVKSSEIYAQSGNEVLEDFIEKYPEYKPENDTEDVRWNTFKNILVRDYNRTGKSTKELNRIFEKVNRDVLDEFGESPKKAISQGERKAQKQKIRSVSHSGGTKVKVSKKSNAPTDPTIRAMFKDFKDEDFDA